MMRHIQLLLALCLGLCATSLQLANANLAEHDAKVRQILHQAFANVVELPLSGRKEVFDQTMQDLLEATTANRNIAEIAIDGIEMPTENAQIEDKAHAFAKKNGTAHRFQTDIPERQFPVLGGFPATIPLDKEVMKLVRSDAELAFSQGLEQAIDKDEENSEEWLDALDSSVISQIFSGILSDFDVSNTIADDALSLSEALSYGGKPNESDTVLELQQLPTQSPLSALFDMAASAFATVFARENTSYANALAATGGWERLLEQASSLLASLIDKLGSEALSNDSVGMPLISQDSDNYNCQIRVDFSSIPADAKMSIQVQGHLFVVNVVKSTAVAQFEHAFERAEFAPTTENLDELQIEPPTANLSRLRGASSLLTFTIVPPAECNVGSNDVTAITSRDRNAIFISIPKISTDPEGLPTDFKAGMQPTEASDKNDVDAPSREKVPHDTAGFKSLLSLGQQQQQKQREDDDAPSIETSQGTYASHEISSAPADVDVSQPLTMNQPIGDGSNAKVNHDAAAVPVPAPNNAGLMGFPKSEESMLSKSEKMDSLVPSAKRRFLNITTEEF